MRSDNAGAVHRAGRARPRRRDGRRRLHRRSTAPSTSSTRSRASWLLPASRRRPQAKIQSEITQLQEQLKQHRRLRLVLRPELAVGRLQRGELRRDQDRRIVVHPYAAAPSRCRRSTSTRRAWTCSTPTLPRPTPAPASSTPTGPRLASSTTRPPTWSVSNLDISALTDSADDVPKLEQYHQRCGRGHQGDDRRGHHARRRQVAHRPADRPSSRV